MQVSPLATTVLPSMSDVLAETKLSPERGDPLDRVMLSTPRGHHGMTVLESGGEADGLELRHAATSPDTASPNAAASAMASHHL